LFKLGLVEQLQDNQDRMFVLRLLLQGLVMVLFALALPAVWRRFGAGYGTYTAVAVALPLLGSANFASHGRFALMAFPVFGVLGERLAKERPRGACAMVAASGIALGAVASLWGRGHWMS
jgi:multisubunit Na+/H+ antiporter MnhB subunit